MWTYSFFGSVFRVLPALMLRLYPAVASLPLAARMAYCTQISPVRLYPTRPRLSILHHHRSYLTRCVRVALSCIGSGATGPEGARSARVAEALAAAGGGERRAGRAPRSAPAAAAAAAA